MTDGNVTKQRRVRTEQTLNALRSELLCQDWTNVYEAVDADLAYDSFLDIFLPIYDNATK